MPLGEPKAWRDARNARLALTFPEFAVSDADGILAVDGQKVARGELPSTFGQTVARLAAEGTRRQTP
jgi:hypothetical protein